MARKGTVSEGHRGSRAPASRTSDLAPLQGGQTVLVQYQTGNRPLQWDRRGVIVEVLPYRQYSYARRLTATYSPQSKVSQSFQAGITRCFASALCLAASSVGGIADSPDAVTAGDPADNPGDIRRVGATGAISQVATSIPSGGHSASFTALRSTGRG